MKSRYTFLMMMAAVALAQPATAALVSLDLGPSMATVTTSQGGDLYTADLKNAGNAGAADQIGIWENSGTANVWNYKAANSHTGLYDADGVLTGVGYSITQVGSVNPASGWPGDDLLSDGYYADPGQTIPWAITGLVPNASYELVVYTNSSYSASLVTVNGTAAMPYTGSESPKDYTEETQFWYFQVQADGDGKLNGVSGFAPGDSTHNTFTGFQLRNAVPEPSALALLGMGVGGLLLRRKRGQRNGLCGTLTSQ
jgi:hypothetical protein